MVSHEDWLAARTELLAREKKFTRLRDELSRQQRALPWERVEREYVFDGPEGKETLADLFDGRSQLVVYHFMFPPEDDEGCPSCSFWADSFDANVIHLHARDVTFVAVSAGAAREARCLQAATRMDLQMGVVGRQRLQLRLPRLVQG